jgi:hypothetical protein
VSSIATTTDAAHAAPRHVVSSAGRHVNTEGVYAFKQASERHSRFFTVAGLHRPMSDCDT